MNEPTTQVKPPRTASAILAERWYTIEATCHECGRTQRGSGIAGLQTCAACNEPVCDGCTCAHEAVCLHLTRESGERTCCLAYWPQRPQSERAAMCPCTCHDPGPEKAS